MVARVYSSIVECPPPPPPRDLDLRCIRCKQCMNTVMMQIGHTHWLLHFREQPQLIRPEIYSKNRSKIANIQSGPERMQHLIVNFMNIVDETKLFYLVEHLFSNKMTP